MVTTRKKRKWEKDAFSKNACKIIEKMLTLDKETKEDTTMLVEEILHSIFFLGAISDLRLTPEDIVSDEVMLKNLEHRFPNPFIFYSSQLPKRSPISCLLDMVVKQKGQKNEIEIKQSLKDLIKSLEDKFLVSSTICVSQKSKDPSSVRYYGVSMSTTGSNPGNIVLAASCLSAWDNYVADAVMTYYPEKDQKGKEYKKKSYFDGTIKLPESVVCKAYSLRNEDEMSPCQSCGNLFGLQTGEEKEWPYGHCAEAESLSNLLKNEQEVKRETEQKPDMCKPENRQKAIESVLDKLRALLRTIQFNTWDGLFYNPQS